LSIEFNIEHSKKILSLRKITPSVFVEDRGSIWTSYSTAKLEGLLPDGLFFNHDKFSSSKRNVLRGIHGDYKSWKLVSCVSGEIMQVVVDMRETSPTFLAHECFSMGSNNHQMLLLPPGVGNAFFVKSAFAVYHYKLAYHGSYVDADEQFTVPWDDPRLNIAWPSLTPILSERDKRLKHAKN
jgi:dTDP-4-dehydrorhamnose 3,5-epimerase